LAPVILAALVAAGCGPASRRATGPTGEPGVLPDVPGLAEGNVGASFALPGDGAERYDTERVAGQALEGLTKRVVAGLELGSQAGLVRDGRLERAAAIVLEAEGGGVEINTDVVRRIMWWLGVPEAAPAVGLFSGGGGADQERRVRRAIAEKAAQGHRLFGLAETAIPGGIRVVMITLVGGIEIDPLPRQMRRGEPLRLAGRFDPPHTEAKVTATDPDGGVLEVETTVGDRRFEASFTPDRPGRWQVEVLADGPRGPWVLANFPVAVDVAPETTVTSLEFELESRDPAALAELLFRAINASRDDHGLGPVKRSTDLDRVCSAYSEEMATTREVAHVSPVSGDPGDRVAAAGLSFARLKENLARAHSAAEAHMGLMRSPAHRANILDPLASEAGVGVALLADPDGDTLYVTELIVSRPPAVDPAEAADVAFDKVNQLRKAKKLSALDRHGWLDKVAEKQLGGCFGGGKSPAIKLKGSPFKGVAVLKIATASLPKILEQAPNAVVDPGYSHLGVAVEQGEHPKLGPGTICIQMVFGKRK
jgi:uncharacterized protein YkwD